MKSKWKVESNFIGGEKYYIPYRNIDTSKTDHSGNREYHGGYVENREDAQTCANKLNDINLCDTCERRSYIPECFPDDIEFGEGHGNDNIIKCGNYLGEENL